MIDEKILKSISKNPAFKKLLGQMELTSSYLMAFAQTYLGEYDEEGNQIEKGDRDYILEALEEIKQRLERIEKAIEEMKKE